MYPRSVEIPEGWKLWNDESLKVPKSFVSLNSPKNIQRFNVPLWVGIGDIRPLPIGFMLRRVIFLVSSISAKYFDFNPYNIQAIEVFLSCFLKSLLVKRHPWLFWIRQTLSFKGSEVLGLHQSFLPPFLVFFFPMASPYQEVTVRSKQLSKVL
jgi:hypothetical protein